MESLRDKILTETVAPISQEPEEVPSPGRCLAAQRQTGKQVAATIRRGAAPQGASAEAAADRKLPRKEES